VTCRFHPLHVTLIATTRTARLDLGPGASSLGPVGVTKTTGGVKRDASSGAEGAARPAKEEARFPLPVSTVLLGWDQGLLERAPRSG